jgi:hypothetical protein
MTALWGGLKSNRLATQKTRKDRKSHRLSGFLLASFGPVEMCELSELCELSPQDVVESLSVKSAMRRVGLFFEETQGLGRPIVVRGRVFNHL